MCSIAGFVSHNKSYDSEKIVSIMLNEMKHRGPDGYGIQQYDNVTLGMNRLAIIDNKPHAIPFEKDNYSIIYNGEIFNHNSIISQYKNRIFFETSSDIETVLVSYMYKKEKALSEFNGMFAFSIYNQLDKTLFIAKDRVGKSPLYYVKGEDFFAFASEIKALLTLVEPVFHNEISYEAYEFSIERDTLFKDIKQLLAGEYLILDTQSKKLDIKINSYYKIWDNYINLPDDKVRLTLKLSELIEDSVLLRTNNRIHDYTSLLSGGIDSSLIASIAKPDILYTAHYDYQDFDELDYAKLMAKSINRELKIIKPNKDDFLKYHKDIVYYLDTPATWTSFTLFMLLKQIKEDGFKIVLSGEGADELFGGYYRYLLLYHDELLSSIPQMQNYKFLMQNYFNSPVKRYAKLINRGDEKSLEYIENSIQLFYEKSSNIVDFMGITDFYTTMQVLLQMADRLSFSNQIENRSPFLDHRIIEFAFSISHNYKINDYVTKYLLRDVAKKFVPLEIVNRIDKRGFSAPINRWFNQFENKQYDRNFYKNMVFNDWRKIFKVKDV